MSKKILRPTPASTALPPTSTRTARPSSSFFTRLYAAVTKAMTPEVEEEPVKVRLINNWYDITLDRINQVVNNWLYDPTSRWDEIERTTGLRREQLFYTASALLAFLIFHNDLVGSVILIMSVVIPTISTLQAINSGEGSQQLYWLRYWALFGAFSTLDYVFCRMFPNSNLDHVKLGLLVVTFVPFYPTSTLLYDKINGLFLAIREKFENYNYQLVS